MSNSTKDAIRQLIGSHGDVRALAAASGISAITWQRWEAGKQSPRAWSKARAAVAFAAAGLASPWPVEQEPHRQDVVVPSLFDLTTFEPVAIPAPVVFAPTVWGGLAKPVIESLAEASMCNYRVEEDRGSVVVLRDTSVQGGTLTQWRVIGTPTQSYAIQLPDGRLVEFIHGSAVPLVADTDARKAARAARVARRAA